MLQGIKQPVASKSVSLYMFLISIYAVNILKSSTDAMHPSLSSNNKKEKGALYASYRVLYSYIHTYCKHDM
jgi:hypothetical protein